MVNAVQLHDSEHRECPMNPKSATSEFAALFELPVAERLQLVEDLWDSIAADNSQAPLAPWQLAELKARAERYDAGLETLHTWDDVMTDARAKACGN